MFRYKMGILNISSAYIAKYIGLIPLPTRRKYFDLMFLYKLINDMINCSELLSQIIYKAPIFSSRNILSFYVPFNSRNYVNNSLIYRLP